MLAGVRRHPRICAALLALALLALAWPCRFYTGPYEGLFVEPAWEPLRAASLHFLGRVVLPGARVTRYAPVVAAVLLGNELLQRVELRGLDELRWPVWGEVLLGSRFRAADLLGVAVGVGLASCIDAVVGPRRTLDGPARAS